MKAKVINFLILSVIFTIITAVFFYPVFIKGYVPFPADLLLAEYQPWRSYSYNGIAAGAIPNKAQYFDSLRQMYPWKTFEISAVRSGVLPLWNPHNFSGSPLLANFQSGVFYPLNILYFLFSQTTAWTISVILQPLLSLIFVYMLVRHYKLSKIAAVFSAISYAFSLYMTTFLEYNIMGHFMYLVPLAMLAVEWLIAGKRWALFLLAGTVAVSGFAGHAQLFAGMIGYILFYITIRTLQTGSNFKERLRMGAYLIFFVLTGIGISAVQLLPGIELVRESARSPHPPEYFYSNLLIRPSQLILYLIPDLFGNPAVKNYLAPFSYPSKAIYIGIGAIYFALIGFLSGSRNEFWKVTAIITVITSSVVFFNPISFILFRFNIPFLSTSSPSNFIFMVSLGLSLAAGFGIDQLFKQKQAKHYIILAFFWITMSIAFIITLITHTQIVANNLIYSFIVLFFVTFVIGLLRIVKKKNVIFILLLVISCFDLFYFFHKFNPFAPKTYMYPPTQINNWLVQNAGINRFWGYGNAGVQANFATQNGVYSPDGYDPLYPKYYGQLIQASGNGIIPETFTEKTRSDAVIVGGYGQTDMVDNTYRLKMLSLMGVKYVLDKVENGSTPQTFPSGLFSKVAAVNDFNVFEYKKAAPRFFLTNSFHIYQTKKDFENAFADPEFDPRTTILLNEEPEIDLSVVALKKQATLASYSPNSVRINTKSDANSLLYLSDTYYPGWQAYVDNIPTKIYRTNYAFRSIGIPAGQHRIEFQYKPASLKYGFYMTVVSLILTVIGFIVFIFTYSKKPFKIGYNKKYES